MVRDAVGGWGGRQNTRISLGSSWVFLIGSTHMLDSELPKQTRLCVLPKIMLPGVFIVPSDLNKLILHDADLSSKTAQMRI